MFFLNRSLKNLSSNSYVLLLLFLSALVPLAGAYTSQYGFGLKPCELCHLQRIPFFVVLALSIISVFFRKNPKLINSLIIVSIIAFIVNAGFAFFHIGVEHKWWTHGDCTASLSGNSFEDFRKSVLGAAIVRCDEPQFKFLGTTMADWNFMLNIIYSVFFSIMFKNRLLHAKQ